MENALIYGSFERHLWKTDLFFKPIETILKLSNGGNW